MEISSGLYRKDHQVHIFLITDEISEIDPKDPLHQKFIASYAVLLAKTFEISYPKDFRTTEGAIKIMDIAKKVKAEDFIPNEE